MATNATPLSGPDYVLLTATVGQNLYFSARGTIELYFHTSPPANGQIEGVLIDKMTPMNITLAAGQNVYGKSARSHETTTLIIVSDT